MKIVQLFLTVLIVATAVTGCGQKKEKKGEDATPEMEKPEPITNASLTDGYWKLITLKDVDVSHVEMTDEASLVFLEEESRVAGSNGCNRIGGFYTLGDNNALSFSQLMNTQMACPPNDIEGPFMDVMQSTEAYSISGNTLTLTSSMSETPLAVFVLDPDKE